MKISPLNYFLLVFHCALERREDLELRTNKLNTLLFLQSPYLPSHHQTPKLNILKFTPEMLRKMDVTPRTKNDPLFQLCDLNDSG